MSSIQPAGISSYLSWKERKLYLQTEFALRPQPRITTTVSCEGQVIHKVEEAWEGGLRREEDKKKLESLIRRQHKQVRAMVRNKAEEILASHMPKPLPKFWEQLSKMEGIENTFAFDQEGKVLYQERESEISKRIMENVISAIQLANFLSQLSKFGNLNKSIIQTDDFKVILFQRRGNYFVVHLNKEKEIEAVIHKIENVLK
jgi:predicted regulator of Ras-like GTPase activity (Roadblock/LC7/MglB family)